MSKARNAYGEVWKEKYHDLRTSSKTAEGQPIAANGDYIAVSWDVSGGGSIGVLSVDSLGVRKPPVYMYRGHKGPIHDIDFSPFYDTIFVSASEDTTIKLWEVIPDSATTSKQESLATLRGHEKKVFSSAFNPVADWILGSGSADGTLKVWDIEQEKNAFSGRHPDMVCAIAWNASGSLLGTTCKDKKLRLLDPRNQGSVIETICHEGTKSAKLVWLSGLDVEDVYFLTTGFSKSAAREVCIWDVRDSSAPILRHVLDRLSGTIIPFWDDNCHVLYLAGKGDCNIRAADVSEKTFALLPEFRTSTPCKANAFLPTRGLDVMRCEIARAIRTEGTTTIQPVSFIVPRKSTEFQEDLFPDCRGDEPSMTAGQWLRGDVKMPIRQTMQPDADGVSPFRLKKPTFMLGRTSDGSMSQSGRTGAMASNDRQASRLIERMASKPISKLPSGMDALGAGGGDVTPTSKVGAISHSPAVLKKELTRAATKIQFLSDEAEERHTTARTLITKNAEMEGLLKEKADELEALRTETASLRKKLTAFEDLYSYCYVTMGTAAWKEANI